MFGKPKAIVNTEAVDDTDITIIFKDNQALKDFLFTENPDIIGAVIDNAIAYQGNVNHLFKFAFMARNLQLRFMPK